MDTLPLEILEHILTYAVAAPISASTAASCLMTCREFAGLTTDITLRERGYNDNDPYTACTAYCEAVYDDAIINGYTNLVRWFATESAIGESAYCGAAMRESDDMLVLLDSLGGYADVADLVNTITMIGDASMYERIRTRYPDPCPRRDVLNAVRRDRVDILDVIKRQAPSVFDDGSLCAKMVADAIGYGATRIVVWMRDNAPEYVAPTSKP